MKEETVMSIVFRFHPQKAVEAAAWFLKLHGKPMKYIGLLKMLYLADRKALERMDQPITGDCAYSLDYGPVLSHIYDLIKGNSFEDALPLWSKYISRYEDNYVQLKEYPGDDHLCEEEEEIIKEVYKKFGHIEPFQVAEWTHDLPEWKNPRGSRIPIVVDEVLRYINKTDEDIEIIKQTVARENYLDEVLFAK